MSQKKVAVFGDILLRLETKNHQRLVQAREFAAYYSGAEVNVAVSLERFGVSTALVGCVPDTELGEACLNFFRQYGVDTSHVQRRGERLGLYFLETGANQRPSKVIYDRDHSAIAELRPGMIPWDGIFEDKNWLHLSGSTPAVARSVAEVTVEACAAARRNGVKVSLDLNFREKLWRWEPGRTPRELARQVMPGILEHVDVIIGNEDGVFDMLELGVPDDGAGARAREIERCPELARRIKERFPGVKHVALTLRESVSASHNNWGAMLYDAGMDRAEFAPLVEGRYEPYRITHIVDRVGGGDSFCAGLIYGLLNDRSASGAVAFAAAASCLKHSIPGDFNLMRVEDVEHLVAGNREGLVQR